jgi:hypothetical protein
MLTYPARPINGGPLFRPGACLATPPRQAGERRHHVASEQLRAVPKPGYWLYSCKVNGWRALVNTRTRQLWNRHGQPLSIAGEFSAALAQLAALPFEWLDCEAFHRRHPLGRGCLVVLDAILPGVPARERWAHLTIAMTEAVYRLLPLEAPPNENTAYVLHQSEETDRSAQSKRQRLNLWDAMQAANRQFGFDYYEGLVCKRSDSLYPIQLANPDQTCPAWIKHRFN